MHVSRCRTKKDVLCIVCAYPLPDSKLASTHIISYVENLERKVLSSEANISGETGYGITDVCEAAGVLAERGDRNENMTSTSRKFRLIFLRAF